MREQYSPTMHRADAELLHQAAGEIEAARELERNSFAATSPELRNYHNKFIVAAAVSGAEDADSPRRCHHLPSRQKVIVLSPDEQFLPRWFRPSER